MIIKSGTPGSRPALSFRNAMVKEEGPAICARMGLDRAMDSSFDYSSERLSISATVRKKEGGAVCQDAAIALIGANFAAIGVFDGFQRSGTMLSEIMADSVLEILRDGRAASLLSRAYQNLFREHLPQEAYYKGGTTATVVVVQHDGGIYANGVCDSPAYRIRAEGVERLLEYRFGPKKKPVSEMTVEEYLDTRHLVSNPIDLECFDASKTMGYGGMMLGPETVLVASDGLTKNMRIRCDPETRLVTDNSGCGHLARRLRGLEAPRDMVRAVEDIVLGACRYEDASGIIIEPENDDLSAVVLTMHRLER